jgi:Mg2+-importing ATPase
VPPEFWSLPQAALLDALKSSAAGLSSQEASARLARFGPNVLAQKRRTDSLTLFLSQFTSPIILLLIAASVLSYFLNEPVDASIILVIVLASGLLSFWQERGAADAVEKLLATVQVKATVLRDGKPVDLPVEQLVPGDVTLLDAGDVIPGDCLILQSMDLFVDEAALTGETYPVDKAPGVTDRAAAISARTNALFLGTHVVSGTATAVVVYTGTRTEFGAISERLKYRPPETEFERGLRRFGYLLVYVTLVMVLAIFALNVYFARPLLDSFLFALALAVGLTPQLLPAIVSINLAQGARRMAQDKVIVKRLASIENFGSMDVLCSDKTGTITEGVVHLESAVDAGGTQSDKVLLYAYLNASFESGFTNPIDQAIRDHTQLDISGYRKLDEVPYDFIRKRLTILVQDKDQNVVMITKGAVDNVLSVCSSAETAPGNIVDIAGAKESILGLYQQYSNSGYRTLAMAYRDMGKGPGPDITKDDEVGMTFLGLLLLNDPPKAGVIDTISHLNSMGVSLKIITGDNRLVAAHVAGKVGLDASKILAGGDLHTISDDALIKQVRDVSVFAEVEPNQKERILLALRKCGDVVGYMGDGINDASALHAADVGISVNTAVDVAKEAADIVLLEQDLSVLAKGVSEGRNTFANTLKYINITTSANFGNVFSMAVVSLIIPFLPLLPTQILLNNFLTDFPATTIATDNVDPEMVVKPRRWNVKLIRNFMIVFGLQSSVFDFLTFATLLLVLNTPVEQFRTGWFLESAISEILILLVIRTKRVFFKSLPSRPLLIASIGVAAFTLILPYTPLGTLVELVPLPLPVLFAVAIILVLYVATAEVVKRIYFKYEAFI